MVFLHAFVFRLIDTFLNQFLKHLIVENDILGMVRLGMVRLGMVRLGMVRLAMVRYFGMCDIHANTVTWPGHGSVSNLLANGRPISSIYYLTNLC